MESSPPRCEPRRAGRNESGGSDETQNRPVLSGALALAAPATASASFVSVIANGTTGTGTRAPAIFYNGDEGSRFAADDNNVVISDGSGPNSFDVVDIGTSKLTVGGGCVKLTSTQAPATGRASGTSVRTRSISAPATIASAFRPRTSTSAARSTAASATIFDQPIALPDDIRGGAASTRCSTTRTSPVIVRLPADAVANDGQGGAEDNIHSDVEDVHGTNGNDSLQATTQSARAFLFGLGGNDSLTGGEASRT